MKSRILEFSNHILAEGQEFLELAEKCFMVSDDIAINFRDYSQGGKEFDVSHIVLGYSYYRSTESFLATIQLVNSGFISDAQAVLRKLVEMAINMRYMCLDIAKYAPMYWYFLYLKSGKMMKRSQSVDVYPDEFKKSLKSLQADNLALEEMAKKYFEIDDKGGIKKQYYDSWPGIDTKEMARRCGMSADYEYCYRLFSLSTHASIEEITNYLDMETGIFGPKIERDTCYEVILETIRYYVVVLDLCICHFGFKLHGSLQVISNGIESLRNNPRLQ